jgi:hypothetical protein
MAKNQIHAIRALATLVALSQFKGQKNVSSLHLCADAVDQLEVFFETRDTGRKNQRKGEATDALPLMAAAKMMGMYEGQKAGQPTKQWIARVTRASRR